MKVESEKPTLLSIVVIQDASSENSRKQSMEVRNDFSKPIGNEHGIAVWATGLLLTGELAGGGIVALPHAVQILGWLPGLILLLVCALLCGYMGIIIGSCWSMLQLRWPEYRDHCKRPYQEIGRRSIGNWMTYVISVTIDFTLFGTCVSYLLLASQNIDDLLITWFNFPMCFCLFMVIVTVVLLPLTFLGTPKDFWQVIVLAMACTTIAFVVILIGMAIDDANVSESVPNTTDIYTNMSNAITQITNITTTPSVEHTTKLTPSEKFDNFFVAFGILIYAYTGHSVFPTVHQDMKEPDKWNWAIIMAFILQLIYYIPVSLLAYFVYGDKIEDDIMGNIATDWCRELARLLISFHVIFSYILMINPVSQEFEHLFRVPFKFCWQRVVVRSCIVVAVLFIAETIPNFGILLSLIGGTGAALLCFVYPPIMYFLLMRKVNKEVAHEVSHFKSLSYPTLTNKNETIEQPILPSINPIPWYINLILLIILVIGAFTVVANAYSSLKTMIDPSSKAFVSPCYIDPCPKEL